MPLRALYSAPSALALGILLALLYPAGAEYVRWLGEIFLSLLKVLILPLILVSLYAALASGVDLRRLGTRTLGYYLLTSTVAASLGTLIGWLLSRGIEPNTMELGVVVGEPTGLDGDRLIASLVPSNLFASLADGNVVHIVIIAILAAVASRGLDAYPRQVLSDGAEAVSALLMQMLRMVLAVAPLGIAALVFASLAAIDWAGVLALRPFVWAVLAAAGLHALLFLPVLLVVRTGRSPLRFVAQVRAALATALATASSSATFPVSKQVLEQNVGVKATTTSFTLPLGATLNMDGSALYQSILLLFMAQLAGVELSLAQALLIVLVAMASSAGTAGIPGGGIAMMAFMLDLLNLPQSYLALYLVVDRFFDYPITAINVWGDLVIAAVVDRGSAGNGAKG